MMSACSSGKTTTKATSHASTRAPASHAATASSSPNAAAAGGHGDFCNAGETVFRKDLSTGDQSPGALNRATFEQHLHQLVAAAPPEIRPDVQAIADFDEAILIRHNERGLDANRVQTAVQHLRTYFAEHCGTQLTIPGGK
jgi:hypothetical protein